MKASLCGIIVNVALIHVAGVVLLSQPKSSDVGQVLQERPGPVQFRMVMASVPRPIEAMTASTQDLASPEVPNPVKAATSPAMSPAPEAPPPVAVEATALEASSETQSVSEEYIPRPLLTTAPLSTKSVIVPFPAQFDGTGRFTSVLSLYIDEDGIVRRVRFDDAPLPTSMKDAARQAFLQTRFRPGQVRGQAVKSMIHIEVVFDNTPITPDTIYTTL